jgi:hypothetical protein
VADGADDNDDDGNAEGDGSMVGQWKRRPRRSRSSKRGLKDWERRRLALVAVAPGCFCSESIGIEEGPPGMAV